VAFLLDLTDPLTENQARALHNHFSRVRGEIVPTRGALELYAVEGDGQRALTARVLKCKPENPNDEKDAEGVGLIKSAKRMQMRWSAEYQSVFDEALTDVTRRDSAPVSPLLESIQSVALSSFNSPERGRGQKVLVFVSDLMQNSSSLSFYGRVPTLKEFLQSDAYRQLQADLSGVAVVIYQISRPEHKQANQALALWVQLFKHQGATVLICDDLLKFSSLDSEEGCKLFQDGADE
jgi:hypothetical protein